MNNSDTIVIFFFAWLLVGGPFLIYGFHQFSEAIKIIREDYHDNYLDLGSPSEFYPGRSMTGNPISTQFLLMKLLFVIPTSIPDDPEVMNKMKTIQRIGRLWNVVGIPLLLWNQFS